MHRRPAPAAARQATPRDAPRRRRRPEAPWCARGLDRLRRLKLHWVLRAPRCCTPLVMQRDATSIVEVARTPAPRNDNPASEVLESLLGIASRVVRREPSAGPRFAIRTRDRRRRQTKESIAVLVLGHVVAPRPQANDHQVTMPTYLTSRYSSMPSRPPSRPYPDAFTPPKGAAGLETMPVLSPTIPDSMPSATRSARPRSVV